MEKIINENLRKLGKLKIPRDTLNSHRFKERGNNRKTLRQVPQIHSTQKTNLSTFDSVGAMVKGLNISGRIVDVAKNAPSGVWKLSKKEVIDIAKKYKFIVPDANKPMKHLGSTGIQLVRYKPGVYYLYKPRRSGPRKYKKRSPFTRHHSKIIKGI